MKQFVKTYQKKIGDFRLKTVDMSIADQINLDLSNNSDWFVHILQCSIDGASCTVVFNVDEVSETQPKINTEVITPDTFKESFPPVSRDAIGIINKGEKL